MLDKNTKKFIVMFKKLSVEVIGGVIVLTVVVFTGTKLIDKDTGAASQILVATVSGWFGYLSNSSGSKPPEE